MDTLPTPQASSNHIKIKPFPFQRFASGRNQNEKHLIKYSISPPSRNLAFHSSSQLTKQFKKTQISSQHQLSKLEYEFKLLRFSQTTTNFPIPITSFFSQIKNLQSLTTFDLKVSKYSHFNTQACLKPLLMSLASLKKLSNFSIRLCNKMADSKLLKMVFKYLKRIKSLTSLSLSFWVFEDISTSNLYLDAMQSGLRKLSQLRSLELILDSINELPEEMNETVNKLALILPQLHFLTKICLSAKTESVSPDAIFNLLSGLKNIKALSDISFDIRHEPIKGFIDPISQGLSLLDPLQIRKLKLQSYQRLDNRGLIQLSEILGKFSSLRTLQLSLTVMPNLPEEGIAALISTLSSLVSLSSLTILLHSSSCKRFVGAIPLPFKHLENLICFSLKITGYTYPEYNEEIQQLFFNIRLLKSIRFFTVAYPQKAVNDENIKVLAESLKEISLLQNLSLDFAYAEKLTNHGIKALACSIKILHNLYGLKIWLKENRKIDNEAILQFIEILRENTCLYSVDFNLIDCIKITSFDELFKAIKQAKNIGEIAFTLPRSAVSSQEATELMGSKVVKRMTSARN